MIYEFKLPDIGEGLVEGEVVKWHVREGQEISESQPLVNVLTDKAEVEIPSPKSGKILKLLAKEGQKVKVHDTFVTFEVAGTAPAAHAPSTAASSAPAGNRPSGPTAGTGGSGTAPPALPSVRRLAAELRVDLAGILGSGPGGRITEEDVRTAGGAASRAEPRRTGGDTGSSLAAGAEERVPFIGIRRRTAEKMAQSHRLVAEVTHMDEADFTALVELREELRPDAEKKGVKLTFMPFILKAASKALSEFPNLNSSLDEEGETLIVKRDHHIGIATAAPQGLIVPVIRDAGKKDVWELAGEVNRLADKVRANTIQASEIQGGTFTITNIGPIGGLFATPIVNHPEVAILGVMKVQPRPVARGRDVVVRDMGNLVLSFDHRVVDGAEAARFLNTLIKHLENPRTLLR